MVGGVGNLPDPAGGGGRGLLENLFGSCAVGSESDI